MERRYRDRLGTAVTQPHRSISRSTVTLPLLQPKGGAFRGYEGYPEAPGQPLGLFPQSIGKHDVSGDG